MKAFSNRKRKTEPPERINSKAGLQTGETDLGSFSALRARAENLTLELIVIETKLAEIEYARIVARRVDSDGQMDVYQAEINKRQKAFDEALENLKEAKAPYWILHNTRIIMWKPEEERAQGRIYELRKKQQALINRVVLPDTLPAPQDPGCNSAGTLRAPEDVAPQRN